MWMKFGRPGRKCGKYHAKRPPELCGKVDKSLRMFEQGPIFHFSGWESLQMHLRANVYRLETLPDPKSHLESQEHTEISEIPNPGKSVDCRWNSLVNSITILWSWDRSHDHGMVLGHGIFSLTILWSCGWSYDYLVVLGPVPRPWLWLSWSCDRSYDNTMVMGQVQWLKHICGTGPMTIIWIWSWDESYDCNIVMGPVLWVCHGHGAGAMTMIWSFPERKWTNDSWSYLPPLRCSSCKVLGRKFKLDDWKTRNQVHSFQFYFFNVDRGSCTNEKHRIDDVRFLPTFNFMFWTAYT